MSGPSRKARLSWVISPLGASRVGREDPHVGRRQQREGTSWERLTTALAAWPGRGLLSHEFFSAASAAQAERMVGRLAPAEVHVVVTARDRSFTD